MLCSCFFHTRLLALGWWTLGPTGWTARSEGSPWQSGHVSWQREASGRWGVAQGCDCRSILDAIATLIEAQRTDLALVLIEQELNSQT